RRHTRSDRDWSSDVCSSDLNPARPYPATGRATLQGTWLSDLWPGTAEQDCKLLLVCRQRRLHLGEVRGTVIHPRKRRHAAGHVKIGRASCRERVWIGVGEGQ